MKSSTYRMSRLESRALFFYNEDENFLAGKPGSTSSINAS